MTETQHGTRGEARPAAPRPSPAPGAGGTARARRRSSTRIGPKLGRFSLFALPGLLAYVVFVLIPIGMTGYYSFTNRNPFNPPTKWVGLRNYGDLLGDQEFRQALVNTVIITVIVAVFANVGGLLIAMLLDRPTRLYVALRAIFFTPVVLSAVVISVIWQAVLTDDGLLNSLLRGIGVDDPPGWLSDPDLALYSIAWIITWQMLGFCVVVYLAGLQGVPRELQEAASIDGAGRFARFRNVTWPMLAPALTINTVMLLITGFKAYDQIQVITNGGPGAGTTSTMAFQVVQTAFNGNHIGYSSAMAAVMLALVATVSVVTLRLLQRREVTQ
ncbi:carbohydrate ABC transporter permease [Planotetraspora kaengkrachanensis]|uniref:Sugar ABC transporter permease n=1 Tax=Planotetraspora kaengkrachanensis TaxID=575193 RepID=A0A8J3Q086_9ACTN|nr:sugar ABC transporter permease [Planotetraspora kaengkrachanensis]GIG84377.1 sugar ABC transporter permease [Planotetraspora kaengkrachanensis]